MHVATRDGIAGLHHLPFLIRLAHRTLHQRVTAPFEPTQAPRCAQSFEWPAACRSGGAAKKHACPPALGSLPRTPTHSHPPPPPPPQLSLPPHRPSPTLPPPPHSPFPPRTLYT